MRRGGVIALGALILVAALTVPGSAATRPVIGISVVGTEHHWDITAFNSAVQRVKELGGEVIALDGERKAEKQRADIETLVARRPDAIIVILGVFDSLKPALEKVHEAGIPLITVDLPTPWSVTNVSSNPYVLPLQSVLKMVEDLRGKGNIAVFYRPGPRVGEQRYNALREVLKDFPEIKIIAEQPYVIPGTVPHARRITENWLLQYGGKLNAIWAIFDMPLIGAAQAIEEAGLQDRIKVYGIDGDPQAVAMIERGGAFAATAAQQPAKIGKTAVDMAFKVIKGEKVPPFVYVESFLVTKENAAEAKKILFGS